ncbi:MAG: hypothetical protein CL676_12820 [Bdellovibrionaceae bacterium]|nr:hypothetical protein [Pseudobdellovibrionaceae bacterium]|tara:strand:+ start:2669 stop:5077 length:2409 start_codon:yes stop_codon:yes gene_type:complete
MEASALSFKRFAFGSLFAFSLSFSLVGCGLNIGEDPIPEGEVKLEGYSCVNQISEKVSEYFNDQLNEPQIVEFVDCLKNSVSDFTKRVGRRNDNVYSPEDLQAFINRIAKGRKLEKKLLDEFMKIKTTFVGGRVDQISRADLAAALRLLEDIKKAAILLRPHVRIFNVYSKATMPLDRVNMELDQTAKTLDEISQIFLNSLNKTENDYSLKDFEVFLDEFRKFIGWYEFFPDGRNASQWVELVASIKKISTGGDRYVIQKSEWEKFLTVTTSSYIAFLKFKYGVLGQDLWSGFGLKNLILLFDQIRDEVIKVISSRSERAIPLEEIQSLIQSLGEMKWLPFGLDADTSFLAMKLILTKILDNSQSVDVEISSLRIFHILRMAKEFEVWASNQIYLSSKFSKESNGVETAPGAANFYRQGVPAGWSEFLNFQKGRRPLFMKDSPKVSLVYFGNLKERGISFDLYNLSLTHLYFRVVKLVFEAYGTRDERGQLLMSSSTLQKFYTDFFKLGEGVGWLDPRSRSAGARSYVEGNLFTYSADGLNKPFDMTLSEGVDVIAYLLTAGQLADEVYADLRAAISQEDSCLISEGSSFEKPNPKDFRGDEKLSRECVKKHLFPILVQHLDFAPSLKEWMKSLDDDRKQEYADLLLTSAYSEVNSDPNWVEKSELSTVAVVILYSESVMTRHDTSMDGILSKAEALVAFPIFRNFINDLAKGLENQKEDYSEGMIRSIYEFILSECRAPESNMDRAYIKWNSWGTSNWEIHSDRMKLTQAFSVIINRLLNLQAELNAHRSPQPLDETPSSN